MLGSCACFYCFYYAFSVSKPYRYARKRTFSQFFLVLFLVSKPYRYARKALKNIYDARELSFKTLQVCQEDGKITLYKTVWSTEFQNLIGMLGSQKISLLRSAGETSFKTLQVCQEVKSNSKIKIKIKMFQNLIGMLGRNLLSESFTDVERFQNLIGMLGR